MNLKLGLFLRRQIGAQGEGDPARQLGLEREQVGDLAIERIVPNVKIGARVDELGVDPHPVRVSPHGSFENVSDAERLADFTDVARAGPILAHRSAADHFQVRDLGQIGQNVVLDTVGKIGVLLIVAQVFER